MRPEICKSCSYPSIENPKVKFCRLCHVTEDMELNYEEDKAKIDLENDFELVASVSYNRKMRQFVYSGAV